jgi:hypothetical protein
MIGGPRDSMVSREMTVSWGSVRWGWSSTEPPRSKPANLRRLAACRAGETDVLAGTNSTFIGRPPRRGRGIIPHARRAGKHLPACTVRGQLCAPAVRRGGHGSEAVGHEDFSFFA